MQHRRITDSYPRELAQVLADLKRRAPRLPNVQMNLAIIRLASCCGLRASEIAGLRFGDVHTGVTRPFLSIRAETDKDGKPRRVPLWWDAGTLADLEAWIAYRRKHGPRVAILWSVRSNGRLWVSL